MSKRQETTSFGKKVAATLVAASAMLVVLAVGSSPAAASVPLEETENSPAYHTKKGKANVGGCDIEVLVQYSRYGKTTKTEVRRATDTQACRHVKVTTFGQKVEKASFVSSTARGIPKGHLTINIPPLRGASPLHVKVCAGLQSSPQSCETFSWNSLYSF